MKLKTNPRKQKKHTVLYLQPVYIIIIIGFSQMSTTCGWNIAWLPSFISLCPRCRYYLHLWDCRTSALVSSAETKFYDVCPPPHVTIHFKTGSYFPKHFLFGFSVKAMLLLIDCKQKLSTKKCKPAGYSNGHISSKEEKSVSEEREPLTSNGTLVEIDERISFVSYSHILAIWVCAAWKGICSFQTIYM